MGEEKESESSYLSCAKLVEGSDLPLKAELAKWYVEFRHKRDSPLVYVELATLDVLVVLYHRNATVQVSEGSHATLVQINV